jgi:putative ABC transport system permease protein
VAISVDQNTSRHTAEREAYRIPGVVAAEGWANVNGIIKRANGAEGEETNVVGLPWDSIMVDPKMIEGRWLNGGDSWEVVVNQDLVQEEDIGLGDDLVVDIDGVDRVFKIVGITSKTISGPRVYINYTMFSKLTGRSDQVNEVRIRTNLEGIVSPEEQEALAALVEDRFSNAGLSNASASTRYQVFGFFTEPFAIILMVLMIMAGLLAVVGSLSLAGTMGINVMERTREIGVLRSVGASNASVRQVVVVEGVMIALLSWVLVTVISGPTSASLAGAVIYTVLKTNLTFRFSFLGLGLWLLMVVFIGIFSSLAPAQNAVRLTVREVLDYE